MKKQIGIRFSDKIIAAIDKVCKIQDISRTSFIDQACREKLNSLGIKPKNKKNYLSGNPEDWEL